MNLNINERIKELKDMMYMINNYQIIGAIGHDYFIPARNCNPGRSVCVMEKHKFYQIHLKRTEYSKRIIISYNHDELTKESYDEYGIISMGVDNLAVIGVKQLIVEELMQLGAEKVF